MFTPYHAITSDRVEAWSISIAENLANRIWGYSLEALTGISWDNTSANPIDAAGNFRVNGFMAGVASVMVKMTTEIPLIFLVTPFVALAALVDDAVEAATGESGTILDERTNQQNREHDAAVALDNFMESDQTWADYIAAGEPDLPPVGIPLSAGFVDYYAPTSASIYTVDFGGPGSNAYNGMSFSSWESSSGWDADSASSLASWIWGNEDWFNGDW
ncbi:MAG: hypothetical protein IPH80_28360 [Myxococcales bacterium]|nr:hypothetical protein [Myxococcales bacterium]